MADKFLCIAIRPLIIGLFFLSSILIFPVCNKLSIDTPEGASIIGFRHTGDGEEASFRSHWSAGWLGQFINRAYQPAESIVVMANVDLETWGNPTTLQRIIHNIACGYHSRVIRVKVNKRISVPGQIINGYVTSLGPGGLPLSDAKTILIPLYLQGEDGNYFLFWSQTPDFLKGKPIIFVTNPLIQGDNQDAIIIYGSLDGDWLFRIPLVPLSDENILRD